MSEDQSSKTPTPFDDGDLYDLLCEGLDYGVDFYLALAKDAAGPVLDMACGTGRILLPCLEAGVDIDGADLSPAMLETLRRKAAARGFQPRVFEADMSRFRLDRRYALIMIPFNAFVHNLTTHDQISTLACCRQHLLPNGLLVFDGYFPSLEIIGVPNNTRVLEGETKDPRTGLAVRCYDTRTFDRVAQRQHSINEIEMLDAEGNVTAVHRSETTLRWIYKFEMELLLRTAGFEQWEIFGGFDRQPLVKETDGMVAEARQV